eukprot:CAMPEP_0119104794 /NCGR_PEP_ID=MMETSP1180-20130426/2916_1 /TAXON_ID=3052 ORGANISM="Chlamydomonas cf sp, Strain CCMP681" /NCGR_SAMPLE_ID=MMETSP1180 /ASSEMBLY_ACC=CAM_ASM_000741 /LENGTH=35 /DNA_ID= /DNA_START= /DNA_END= /DNA_ORIENTATION=
MQHGVGTTVEIVQNWYQRVEVRSLAAAAAAAAAAA